MGTWFDLKGDQRLGRCATEGCGGQPTFRLEAEGIGSNYCSGCRQKIDEFWDEDGCYCVCGTACSCERQPIVNVDDELHRILKDALDQARDKIASERWASMLLWLRCLPLPVGKMEIQYAQHFVAA